MTKLFLDCDGVLADFDAGAQALLGMTLRHYEARHGRGAFWKRLANAPDFYVNLPEMPDARQLFDAVAHLEFVRWQGLFHPAYKVNSDLRGRTGVIGGGVADRTLQGGPAGTAHGQRICDR